MTNKPNCSFKIGTKIHFNHDETTDNNLQKAVTKTWNSDIGNSCTMTVPKKISRRLGLDKPSHVVIEEKIDGFFIKKIDIG